MSQIGNGVPPPATIANIINDLFENEKYINLDGTITYITFSQAHLTRKQRASLIYPKEVSSINLYVIYQIEKVTANKNIISTDMYLVSFAKKNGFIYGYYYNTINQKRIRIDKLTQSTKPIKLSDRSEFIYDNYIEIYNDVLGTTVILGLRDNDISSASLQYANKSRYYYEKLLNNGLEKTDIPTTVLIGLSENLLII